MKKKYISELIQTLVDVVYFKVYSHSIAELKEYITNGYFEMEISNNKDENEMIIYDSLIYPDFLKDKYFLDYSDKEHDDLESYLSSVSDVSDIRIIKVFNIYRMTHTIRYHLAHYLYSFFAINESNGDNKSFEMFKMKLNFVLSHIEQKYQMMYYQLWQDVIEQISSDNTIINEEDHMPLGKYISKDVYVQLKDSFYI